MTSTPPAPAAGRPARIAVPVWAWPITPYGLTSLFLVSADTPVHQVFHDARHTLGVPCH